MDDPDIHSSLGSDPTVQGRWGGLDDLDYGQTIRGFVANQQAFGRYQLKQILGRGGMGLVWLAWDTRLERDVALKFMPEMVRLDSFSVDELKRETRKSLDLTHPHIVRIYDFVQDSESAAIAMEYVDGPTLSAHRLSKPRRIFEPDEILEWMVQLCGALDYAHHDAKIVHRDLKPSNVMLTASGKIKVTDFGISQSLSDSVSRLSVRLGSGTPAYMSPQQALGTPPQPTDDIYSMGATIYDLLTGKPPFFSGDILAQVREIHPPPMHQRRRELGNSEAGPIPKAWEETVAACLAKQPQARPRSFGEVIKLLTGHPPVVLARKPDAKFRWRAVSTGVLLLGVLFGACAVWWFYIEAPRAEQSRIEKAARVAESERLASLENLLTVADTALSEKRWADSLASYQSALELDSENLRAQKGVAATKQGMEAQHGFLVFESPIPPGSLLIVNGEALGGPESLSENGTLALKEGTHDIRLVRPNFQPIEQQVTITNDTRIRFQKLQWMREHGKLTVTTDPEAIRLKLVPTAEEPDLSVPDVRSGIETSIPVGAYDLQGSLDGQVWRIIRAVTITPNRQTQVNFTWPLSPVTINSSPSAAEVYLLDPQGGETLLGKTPVVQPMLAGASPAISVRAPGYQPTAMVGTVEEGKPLALNATLQKLPPTQTPSPSKPKTSKPTASTANPKPSSNPIRQGIENQYRRGQITREEYLNAIKNL